MTSAYACCKDLNGKLIRHKVLVNTLDLQTSNEQAFASARQILMDRGYNITDNTKVFLSFGA